MIIIPFIKSSSRLLSLLLDSSKVLGLQIWSNSTIIHIRQMIQFATDLLYRFYIKLIVSKYIKKRFDEKKSSLALGFEPAPFQLVSSCQSTAFITVTYISRIDLLISF